MQVTGSWKTQGQCCKRWQS